MKGPRPPSEERTPKRKDLDRPDRRGHGFFDVACPRSKFVPGPSPNGACCCMPRPCLLGVLVFCSGELCCPTLWAYPPSPSLPESGILGARAAYPPGSVHSARLSRRLPFSLASRPSRGTSPGLEEGTLFLAVSTLSPARLARTSRSDRLVVILTVTYFVRLVNNSGREPSRSYRFGSRLVMPLYPDSLAS